ncbi:MAG: AEC family transporter [Bacteriovoracaceae bacterium]|jgi:hypothetical protein|nr:hypothetical protein [Halobacteriovoraceae bacterium]MDP7318998.1 AEC family transporter [Bacteriovoracaceae bacterium]
MIENLILVLSLIFLGTFSRKINLLPSSTSHVLNSYVLNIALPAMILATIPHLTISGEVLYPIIFHWIFYGLSLVAVLISSKIFKFTRSVTGVLLVVCCLGNTAFLGIPIVNSFYGEEAVAYAVLYDQLGSGFAFILTGAFILPFFTNQKMDSLKHVFTNLCKFPPFIALILAFLCIFISLPSALSNVIDQLAATLIPCAMISVGFQMKYKLNFAKLKPIVVGLVIKMIIIPSLALVSLKILNLNSIPANVSVLQTGMPPMITAGAMAMSSNLENDIAASLVGYGLFVAFVTLPIINFFI